MEYWKLDDDNKKLFRDFIHRLSDNMRGLEKETERMAREAPAKAEKARAADQSEELAELRQRVDALEKSGMDVG